MAEGNSLMQDESVNDWKYANIPDNLSSKGSFVGGECENFEEKDSLLHKNIEKFEYHRASVLPSDLNQGDPKVHHEGTVHLKRIERAETAAETVLSGLEYLYKKCMECGDVLNQCLQDALKELKHATKLKKWSRVAVLYEILWELVPFYNPLLMIMRVMQEITNIVKKNGECLTKSIANEVMMTCNTLEGNLEQLMPLVPAII